VRECPGMSGSGEIMTRKDEQAVAALLSEATVAAAAGKLGISERTLRRWLRRPEFVTTYRAARAEVLGTTLNRLAGLADVAVDALKRNLTAGVPAVQVRCAVAVLTEIRSLLAETDTAQRPAAIAE